MTCVPDGFDLFQECSYTKNRELPDIDSKSHPLHQKFILASQKMGFDTESIGFFDYEEWYFRFFISGWESGKADIGTN